MNKFSSTKNYFYALLLTSAVLALGACSSSDEQSESGDPSQEACAGGGPRGDEGICCDLSQMQGGCPLTE